MIYLLHPDGTIACCETKASAARLERKGYGRISRELYVAYWRRKDRRARAEQERSVGG